MGKGLKRYYGEHHLHFVTCSCYHRLPLFRSVHAKNTFVKILGEVHDRYEFALVGFVVMPEHIHLLIGESPKAMPSRVMQMLKQRVSQELRGDLCEEQPASAGQNRQLPRFWQLRFYDFNVWSRKKRIEKLEYMHMNPVKRGLVVHPKDWPWSSFSFYASRGSGLIRIDPVQ